MLTYGLRLKPAIVQWLSILLLVFSGFYSLSAYAFPEYRSELHSWSYWYYGKLYLAGLHNTKERLAAQCWQESRFKADAYNRQSGASGECQFMQAAWGECLKASKARNISRFNSRWSIKCAGWYDKKLGIFWSTPRSKVQRWRLVLASYNAGPGNIHAAQRKSGNKLLWRDISRHLVEITGWHSKETINYVTNIEGHLSRMIEE